MLEHMPKVPCEEIIAGDRVLLEELLPDPLKVTRTELKGSQVFLYSGTATVVSLFKGMLIERLD